MYEQLSMNIRLTLYSPVAIKGKDKKVWDKFNDAKNL